MPVPRRMHAKPCKGIGCPLHEAIPLGVALELAFHVEFKRRRVSKDIDSQGVVRGDVHRDNGIEKRRIIACLCKCRPHSRDINQCRTAGSIVHHDTIGEKLDLQLARTRRKPVNDRSLGSCSIFACCSKNVLQQDAVNVWKRPKLVSNLRWQVDDVVRHLVTVSFDMMVIPNLSSHVRFGTG